MPPFFRQQAVQISQNFAKRNTMFENLSDRLSKTLRNITGKGEPKRISNPLV
jgi:hypothetical protein